MAFGNVSDGPFSSRQTLGDELLLSSGKLLTSGAGESNNCSKGGVPAGCLSTLAGLQCGAIGRVGGLPATSRVQRVAHEPDQHGAAIGRQSDARPAGGAEAIARMQPQTAGGCSVVNLLSHIQ